MLYKGSVKFWSTSKHQRRAGISAVILMLLLWLGTFALAASPQLHRLLHQDAQSLNHHCLITQVQQYSALGDLPPVVAPAAPIAGLESVCSAEFQLLPISDYRLSPSRGPPAFISSGTVAG